MELGSGFTCLLQDIHRSAEKIGSKGIKVRWPSVEFSFMCEHGWKTLMIDVAEVMKVSLKTRKLVGFIKVRCDRVTVAVTTIQQKRVVGAVSIHVTHPFKPVVCV